MRSRANCRMVLASASHCFCFFFPKEKAGTTFELFCELLCFLIVPQLLLAGWVG